MKNHSDVATASFFIFHSPFSTLHLSASVPQQQQALFRKEEIVGASPTGGSNLSSPATEQVNPDLSRPVGTKRFVAGSVTLAGLHFHASLSTMWHECPRLKQLSGRVRELAGTLISVGVA